VSNLNPEQCLLDHIFNTRYEHLSAETIAATKTFVLDSLGVGISGSRVAFVHDFVALAKTQWGCGSQARVWCTGELLPAGSAAMINAYQIHNQEFDCVHEPAVVHPMAVILSSLTAYAERVGNISGKRFIEALVVAVDVASVIGMSATQPMRFFRPGQCGCFGATAGLSMLAGLSREQTHNALGIAYSQMGGTMQAHVEGSSTLPMQIAFNARNALCALDLAAAGLDGPKNFLQGQFGFFALMEDQGNVNEAFSQLGKHYQIESVSHKPFPTGRAAHGALDGIQRLLAEQEFSPADIDKIVVSAPPLILRLVNRPMTGDMQHNYAKLCLPFIAATLLLNGEVRVGDYEESCLRDPARRALAEKISMVPNGCADPNALAPQSVHIKLLNGTLLDVDLPAVLGNPTRPLSRAQHLEKFRDCCVSAKKPFDGRQINALIEAVDKLDLLEDLRDLVTLTIKQ